MNRKSLAAAVIAAVAACPAAFAEGTVYGKMHTSIDHFDYDFDPGAGTNAPSGRDDWEVSNRSSRLGFKGSEDLGGGLKAIFQIEFGIQSDGGSQQTISDGHTTLRNTFVGLAGDWGTLLAGRHDTPMKMAFYASGNERLGDSIIDLNRDETNSPSGNRPISVFQEFRANNAIAYVSPNFSGFTVAAAVVPGEQDGKRSTTGGGDVAKNDNDGIADHYSLGAWYKGNGLMASAGYELLAYQPDAMVVPLSTYQLTDDQKSWQAGASYTMSNFSFGAQYQDTSNNDFVDGDDYTAWALTGKATFGNNAFSLVYTDSQFDPKDALSPNVDTSGWGIAAEHNFGKRTKVYAAYAVNSVDVSGPVKDQDQDAFSLGMIHSF